MLRQAQHERVWEEGCPPAPTAPNSKPPSDCSRKLAKRCMNVACRVRSSSVEPPPSSIRKARSTPAISISAPSGRRSWKRRCAKPASCGHQARGKAREAGCIPTCAPITKPAATPTHPVRPELVGSEADPKGQRLFLSPRMPQEKDSASTSSARAVM